MLSFDTGAAYTNYESTTMVQPTSQHITDVSYSPYQQQHQPSHDWMPAQAPGNYLNPLPTAPSTGSGSRRGPRTKRSRPSFVPGAENSSSNQDIVAAASSSGSNLDDGAIFKSEEGEDIRKIDDS